MEKSLSPAEYWEWRTTISEMDTKKEVLKTRELELKLLEKDAELVSLRLVMHRNVIIKSSQDAYQQSLDEYKRFKSVLEERLDLSLDGKMIDDVTFEIKEIPNETK